MELVLRGQKWCFESVITHWCVRTLTLFSWCLLFFISVMMQLWMKNASVRTPVSWGNSDLNSTSIRDKDKHTSHREQWVLIHAFTWLIASRQLGKKNHSNLSTWFCTGNGHLIIILTSYNFLPPIIGWIQNIQRQMGFWNFYITTLHLHNALWSSLQWASHVNGSE